MGTCETKWIGHHRRLCLPAAHVFECFTTRRQFGAQGLVFASAQLITAPLVHATMQADVARDIGKSIAALGLEPPRKLLPLRIASTHGDRKVLRPVPAQNPEPKQEPVVHEKPEMCIKYHY